MAGFGIAVDNIAEFSLCRNWRYSLTRRFTPARRGLVAFIGLNPSTADEVDDDATIRRCINFAKDWHYSGLVMLNLFAYRSTDPALLSYVADPVGAANDFVIGKWMREVDQVVCCWGQCPFARARAEQVRVNLEQQITQLHCFGFNKDLSPKHPLYMPADAKLKVY